MRSILIAMRDFIFLSRYVCRHVHAVHYVRHDERDDEAPDDVDEMMDSDVHSRETDDECECPEHGADTSMEVHDDGSDRRDEERVIRWEAIVSCVRDERREATDDEWARVVVDMPREDGEEIDNGQRYEREDDDLLLDISWLAEEIDTRDQDDEEEEVFGGEDEK